MRYLLGFLILFLAPGWADEQLSTQPRFEVKIAPAGLQPTPCGRDVEKTVDFVLELYKRAGPRLGCRFVESAYLLALADWRARGAWNGFLAPVGPADLARIDELNRWLVPQGLSLHVHQEKDRTVMDVLSLGGLEYTAQQSKLKWVAPYVRTTGWAGGYQWFQDTQLRLNNSQPLHTLPFHYLEGFVLGYPDRSIEGYLSPAGDHTLFTVTATIPEVYRFVNGVPLFDLLAQDCNDPGVLATEKNWNTFLQKVYDHPRMQALFNSQEFIAARKEHLLAHAKLIFPDAKTYPRASLEAVRLGLLQGPALRPEDVETQMERRLRAHPQPLLEALKSAASVPDFCQQNDVTDECLERWALRGALSSTDPARRVYELVSTRFPDFYQGALDEQLMSAHRSIPRAELRAQKSIEWRQSVVTFLDLLRIPEFPEAFARLDNPSAQRILEDIWVLRHLPEAESWVNRIEAGLKDPQRENPLSQRVRALGPAWKWPPPQ